VYRITTIFTSGLIWWSRPWSIFYLLSVSTLFFDVCVLRFSEFCVYPYEYVIG